LRAGVAQAPVVVTEGVPVRAWGVLANSREGRAAPRRRRAPRGPVPARGAEGPDEGEVRPRRVVRAWRAVGGSGRRRRADGDGKELSVRGVDGRRSS
ncbi:hypothetical protein THAOC_20549, partial [Thalassiosira oceanica]